MLRILSTIFILASSLYAHENDGALYKQIAADNFGLQRLAIQIDSQEVLNQIRLFSSTHGITDAFIMALHSFFTDGSDFESPLFLAGLYCEERNRFDAQCPRDLLMSFMNTATASISLVDLQDNVSFPKRGEKHHESWLFLLKIPELSDHWFWAVVPRNGMEAYNYGFN